MSRKKRNWNLPCFSDPSSIHPSSIHPSFTYAATSASQNLRSQGLLYEEGRASAEKTPMTKPGTIMNILEAAKKETPQCLGLPKKM
jgi:hypothetical protein